MRVNFANDFLFPLKMAAPERRADDVINTRNSCTVWGQVSTFSATRPHSEEGKRVCAPDRANLSRDIIGKPANDFIATTQASRGFSTSSIVLYAKQSFALYLYDSPSRDVSLSSFRDLRRILLS